MKKYLLSVLTLSLFATIQAQDVIFEETFPDEASFENWTIVDRDGDGELWEYADAAFQEVESFTTGFAWSFSWYYSAFTPDNLLIGPSFTTTPDTSLNLSFKVAAFEDAEVFQEHYAVYVLPADATFDGTETPVFEETLDASYYNPPKTVNVDISEYAGQDVKLVFRHYNVTDIFYIGMDDIMVTTSLGVTDINTQKVEVYPNPTTDLVKIKGADKVERIRVFDTKGSMLREVNSDQVKINDLPQGVYIVNFYTKDQVISRKIQKK